MPGINKGRTLVELLIAMSLGLIVLAAIFSMLVSTKALARINENRARMEEDGLLALNLLAFHVRMAGYGHLQKMDPAQPGKLPPNSFDLAAGRAGGVVALEGCSGGLRHPGAVPLQCDPGKAGDALVVRYMVDLDNANRSATQLPTDCLGQGIAFDPRLGQTMLEARFFVAKNPRSGHSELYCAGNGGLVKETNRLPGAAQPLIEHVSEMRLWYGYDADHNGSVLAYHTAAELNNMAVQMTNSAPHGPWRYVQSVKLCLLLHSAEDQLLLQPQQYLDCHGQLVTASDRRLHAAFNTVIKLRSRTAGEIG